MRVVETIGELRAELASARAAGRTVGFVPTMGYLHEGHRALMAAARAECDLVVVSIFVNPLQFGANEDLAGYPRDAARDDAACAAEGVDLVLRPSVAEMYPQAVATTVSVAGLTDRLCGASRPGHFDGVATVVAKLCNIVGPCRLYLGKKDFQQVAVVRRMVADLSVPVEVVARPTVREDDGLAMSSRNAYLSTSERQQAVALSQGLVAARMLLRAGERRASRLVAAIRREWAGYPLVREDYIAVVDPDTLAPLKTVRDAALVAVAAQVGPARLIDNFPWRSR